MKTAPISPSYSLGTSFLKHALGPDCLAVCGEDESLLISAGEQVAIWNLETERLVATTEVAGWCRFAVSRNSKFLAVAGHARQQVLTLSQLLADGKPVPTRDWTAHQNVVQFVDVSEDGRLVLSGGNDGCAFLTDVHTGQTQPLWLSPTDRTGMYALGGAIDERREHLLLAGSVSRSEADDYYLDQFIAVFSFDGEVRKHLVLRTFITDTAARLLNMEIENKRPAMSAFAYEGERGLAALGYEDGVIQIFSVAENRVLLEFSEQNQEVRGLAFLPDGLLSGGRDGRLRIHDVVTGALKVDLIAHPLGVESVAASRDGTRLVSGGGDGTIQIWDRSGHRVLPREQPQGIVRSVGFGREHQVIVGSNDGSARVWGLPPRESVVADWGVPESSCVGRQQLQGLLPIGMESGEIGLFDPRTGAIHERIPVFDQPVQILECTSESDQVACATFEGSIAIVSFFPATIVCRFHDGVPEFESLLFDISAREAFALSWLRNYHLTLTGNSVKVRKLPDADTPHSPTAAWSPSGKDLIVVGEWDETEGLLILLNRKFRTLASVTWRRPLTSVISLPAHNLVIAGDQAGNLLGWRPGQKRLSLLCDGAHAVNGSDDNDALVPFSGIHGLAVSSDESLLASGGSDTLTKVWPVDKLVAAMP